MVRFFQTMAEGLENLKESTVFLSTFSVLESKQISFSARLVEYSNIARLS